jgi:putative ABC transport system permease protein
MFKNHLKLAWRGLSKRKGYAALNILGLAIGITCCLLIFHYVAYEKSYDKFGPRASQIVRLRLDQYQKGKLAWQSATVYPAIAPAMKKEFPEVADYCRLIDAELLITNKDRNVKSLETKGYYADASVIGMFNLQLLEGDAKTALTGSNKILLSETSARKFFGKEDPLGKRLTVQGYVLQSYEVTGVFRDYPHNSHLIIDHLVSYSTLGHAMELQGDADNSTETAWGWYDFYTYLQLKPGADIKTLEAKLPAFCDRHINSRDFNKSNDDLSKLYLLPMADIHLYSNYNQEAEVNGNGKAVGFLFLVAFLIITIAWVNYTNMATARSLERAKEVGVRKVLGAFRSDLILQFLTESLVLNGLALALALGMAFLFAPSFNNLIGSGAGPFSLPSDYIFGFLAIFFTGAMLSGVYPAFILSSYHPITVLKGLFKNTTRGQFLRKGLIIGQFAVSVILITGTILVYQQVQYMRKQQLGVNINQTLVIQGAVAPTDSVFQSIFQPFKSSLLQLPDVRYVTSSTNVMGQEITWTRSYSRVGDNRTNAMTLFRLGVDYDFLPAYDLKIVAGRNFGREFGTDKNAIILNEKAVGVMGFKNAAEAVNGKIFSDKDTFHVIGVAANYHQQGLQKAITPMMIQSLADSRNYYSVKLNTDAPQATIATIKRTWDRYFPNDPFSYFFLDESFNEQYKADTRFGQVFGVFALLAILIACFGLLGLSAYNVLQRTKEIGIRKVLGASAPSLIYLLSKEFLQLVLLSLLLAIPVTFLVMHSWLQDFAYRIPIRWWVFALGGLLAILIALVTVGLQALRASLSNPIKSLRTE